MKMKIQTDSVLCIWNIFLFQYMCLSSKQYFLFKENGTYITATNFSDEYYLNSSQVLTVLIKGVVKLQ